MLKKILLLIVLINTVLSLQAQSEEDLRKIHEAHDLFGINRFAKAWDLLEEVESDPGLYWRARILHLKGLIRQEEGKKKEAIKCFKQMETFVENSDALMKTSNGMTLLAMSIARQMYLKNIFYALENLKKTIKLTEKALQLESDNFTAMLVLAQIKTKTPKLFGGDINKALELLEEAGHIKTEETAEEFALFMTLALTHSRNKSKELAGFYLNKALEIYPGSSMAVRLKKEELD